MLLQQVEREDVLGTNRYSITSQPANLGPATPVAHMLDPMKDVAVPEKKKRMSLFRSRSSQTKVKQLDITSGVEIEQLSETPVRKPVLKLPERWSRSNSLVDQGENSYAPPIAKNNPFRWSRTNSLVGDDETQSPEKYGSPAVPARWSRSNSLVENQDIETAIKYEFTPPVPRVPVLRTPEQRAQVQRYELSPRRLRTCLTCIVVLYRDMQECHFNMYRTHNTKHAYPWCPRANHITYHIDKRL